MATFTVTEVVDGDTFDVTPNWRWQGQVGSRVRPTGFDAPESSTVGGMAAKTKLERLISGRKIELGTAYKVDRGRLVCDVYFNGQKLAGYFPAYQ